MGLRAFNHGVNILAYEKDGKTYAATYAWFTQVGYEEVLGLLGSQSETANNLKVGDIVGISACSKEQKELAIKIGDTHSSKVNKLENVDYKKDGSAITINGSKCTMICKVLDIMHLKGIEEDHTVYFKVLSYEMNEKLEPLNMYDIEPK